MFKKGLLKSFYVVHDQNVVTFWTTGCDYRSALIMAGVRSEEYCSQMQISLVRAKSWKGAIKTIIHDKSLQMASKYAMEISWHKC